jgi:hypothetical protein
VRLLATSVEQAIKRLSPLNPFGQPKFRLIHGGDALAWIEGWWEDFSPEGLFIRKVFEKRQCHKYLTKTDVWILECWEPPEFFGSPETWATANRQWEGGRGFSECGPYPSEGDYRYLTCFRHRVTGRPTAPTELLIERIFSRLGVPTQDDLNREREAKQAEEKANRKRAVDGMIDEMPFGGKDDAINLNPRGLLDKLKDKRIEEEKSYAQSG